MSYFVPSRRCKQSGGSPPCSAAFMSPLFFSFIFRRGFLFSALISDAMFYSPDSFRRFFSLVFQVGDSAGKMPTPIENKFSALTMDEENDD